MLSEQEQRRQGTVEAEIQQVERLVEANADPPRLSMQWNKTVSSGEFTIRLTLFTKSYVVFEGKRHTALEHDVQIRIPHSYPDVQILAVKIDSYHLFHPEVPLSGEFECRKNLEETVLWLWDVFASRTMDISSLAPNQQAVDWLRRHPEYQLRPGPALRLPSSYRAADDQFKVKDKRGSGVEKQIKVKIRHADLRVRSELDAEGGYERQSAPAASLPAPAPVQGFRSKGVRVYQPQHRTVPELLNRHDEWTHDPDGWRYRVPAQGYVPSSLKVVFLQSALTKIFQHATEINNIERFGILIGGVSYDAERRENWVEIVDMLPAERVNANVASVEVSHEEIGRLNTKVDRILADTGDVIRKIGWYHTHPGHGIFMSGTDQTNQAYCYTADWQVALVVDPIQHHYGVFSGPDCYALTDGVLVLSQEDARRLDTPAFAVWQNNAHRVPGVLRPTTGTNRSKYTSSAAWHST
jgi:proteasome lid subunit RPN8/RPN11